ncbi:MAG: hypothetical protein ABSF99_11425 [Anaerolineales bacterium]|jgi:hypothetical protein
MTGYYAYTPSVWPSVFMLLMLIVLANYEWHRRHVPAAIPFVIWCLLAMPLVVCPALEYLSVATETKIF